MGSVLCVCARQRPKIGDEKRCNLSPRSPHEWTYKKSYWWFLWETQFRDSKKSKLNQAALTLAPGTLILGQRKPLITSPKRSLKFLQARTLSCSTLSMILYQLWSFCNTKWRWIIVVWIKLAQKNSSFIHVWKERESSTQNKIKQIPNYQRKTSLRHNSRLSTTLDWSSILQKWAYRWFPVFCRLSRF